MRIHERSVCVLKSNGRERRKGDVEELRMRMSGEGGRERGMRRGRRRRSGRRRRRGSRRRKSRRRNGRRISSRKSKRSGG